MAELVFHSEGGSAAVSVGHEVNITLSDGGLTADGGPVLASHTEGSWRIGEVTVTRITCDGPISLQLTGAAQCFTFGPLAELVIGNNTIWTKDGPLARYNGFTRTWSVTEPAASEDLHLDHHSSPVAA